MTTKIIEPGGGRYLGLAEQRLSILKALGVPAQQRIKVGDAEIFVSVGADGDRLVIRVGTTNLLIHPVRDRQTAWNFFEDTHPTCGHKLNRGPLVKRPSAPAYYWDASYSVPCASGEYVTFPMVDQATAAEHTYTDTSTTYWQALFPAICEPAIASGKVVTAYGLFASFNLAYHHHWFQAPIGADSTGDPWIVYVSPVSYIDASYKHSAVISKLNLKTGEAEIVWPRTVGMEYGFVSTVCPIGRGKIAFLFHEYSGEPGAHSEMPTVYLVTADLFAGTWMTTNTAAIAAFIKTEPGYTWLPELMFSDITSPVDDVLVGTIALRRWNNATNEPQTVYDCRIVRSTDGGASWSNLTGGIPGGFSAATYHPGALGFGDKFAFSPKPGHVILETGFSNAADTLIQYLHSTDGGATFVSALPTYTQNDVCHVAGTPLYAVAKLPDGYSLTYGAPNPFPNADVPVTLELFNDYLCQGAPLWSGPVAAGNFHAPYLQNSPTRPRVVCFGKTAPLLPGHKGRLEYQP